MTTRTKARTRLADYTVQWWLTLWTRGAWW